MPVSKIPWTRQPQTLPQANTPHPYTIGLTNLIVVYGGRPVQLVGTGMTTSGTLTSKVGPNGVNITNNGEKVSSGTANNYISLPAISSELTVLMYGTRYSSVPAGNVAELVCSRATGDASGFELAYGNGYGDANAVYFNFFGASSGIDCFADGVALTGNNPTNKVVINGVPICFVGSASSHTIGPSGVTILAKALGTANFAYDTGFSVFATWSRKLRREESLELSRNPLLLLAPQERRVFASGASGATILDLTAAALNFTPQSTQNVLTASLTAGASSFTPQDTQNALAAPLSAGALSFTPQGTQNTSVTTLSVGALNFTPQDITAQNGTAPVIVSLDAGTFSFTPQGIQSLNTLNLANATFSNTALDLQILLTANLTAYALNATPQPPQMTTINNLTSSTFNFTPYPIGATGAVTADAGASKMLMGVGY